MSNQRTEGVPGSVVGSLLSLTICAAVEYPTFDEVQRCVEQPGSTAIMGISGQLRVDRGRGVQYIGGRYYELVVVVMIDRLTITHLRHLREEPGGYSFYCTHRRLAYPLEYEGKPLPYEGKEYYTYTHYLVIVDEEGGATYEVLSTTTAMEESSQPNT